MAPVGEQFADLSLFLQERGHDVLIATTTDPAGTHLGSQLEGRVEIALWPTPDGTTIRDGIFISGVVRSWRPDTIIAQFRLENLSLLAGFIHRVPMRIAWFRTMTEASAVDAGGRSVGWRLRVRRKRLVYRFLATHLVSNSRAGVDDLKRFFMVPRAKCAVIPNGIADLGLRDPRAAEDREPVVVTIGRLVRSKNHELALDALVDLRRDVPGVKLVIVGGGPRSDALRDHARAIGVEDAVVFTGKIPYDETMSYLRKADVLAHPTLIDNCPAVIQEAMSLGVPIVTTPVGGIPELVQSEQTALFAPASDGAEFGRQLRRALTDRTLTQRITRAARLRFEQCYQRRTFVERTADYLLATSRPPQSG